MKLIFAALLVFSVCFAPLLCQLTKSDVTDTKKTTPTTPTPATTPSTPVTTKETIPTTATPASTSTPTTSAPTTPAPQIPILSFRLPRNESVPAYFRLNGSFAFEINYVNKAKANATLNVTLDKYTNYDGLNTNNTVNTLWIEFNDEWKLTLQYTLINQAYYELKEVDLDYKVEGQKHTVSVKNLTEFSANKGNSFKCFSNTNIVLDDSVTLSVSNYQAQPFLTEKTQGFDTAIECPADTLNTSKLVPIIVGASLAILVLLVLIAYLIGRRKHRPGYQTV